MAKKRKKEPTLEEQLKAEIEASGLSNYRIGIMANVSTGVLDRFVSGERTLRLPTAGRICAALGLELRMKR